MASYFADVAKLFTDFTQNTCSGKKVVFIPTASIPEEEKFIEEDKESLEKLGLIVDELEISTASQNEIKNKIKDTDYIFVAGGNTFFLLQELKRTGADKLIIEHINNGKIYASTSAGSAIVSKDIGYIKDMDNPSAAPDLNNDFSALGVIDFYIVPHCTHPYFEESVKKVVSEYSNKLNLQIINDNQAVIVKGDLIEIIEVKNE